MLRKTRLGLKIFILQKKRSAAVPPESHATQNGSGIPSLCWELHHVKYRIPKEPSGHGIQLEDDHCSLLFSCVRLLTTWKACHTAHCFEEVAILWESFKSRWIQDGSKKHITPVPKIALNTFRIYMHTHAFKSLLQVACVGVYLNYYCFCLE